MTVNDDMKAETGVCVFKLYGVRSYCMWYIVIPYYFKWSIKALTRNCNINARESCTTNQSGSGSWKIVWMEFHMNWINFKQDWTRILQKCLEQKSIFTLHSFHQIRDYARTHYTDASISFLNTKRTDKIYQSNIYND